MDAASYYASRRRAPRASVYARRSPESGPAMRRDDLFRPTPGAPVLSARERAEVMRRYAPRSLSGLGWGFHFSLPHISFPHLPHISIPSPAALAHKFGLPSPADIVHRFGLPTPADVLARAHLLPGGVVGRLIPGGTAAQGGGLPANLPPAVMSALVQAQQQQSAMADAAAQAAAAQAQADQFVVQQAQDAGAAAPDTALPSVMSLPQYTQPPALPDLTQVNLPAPSPDQGYQPDMSAYQPMPSPAMTVPAAAMDVNAPSAMTVTDTGAASPDFSAGYDAAPSGYDYTGSGSLQGMGDAPATAPADTGWGGTLQNILTAATGVWQQKKLADINITRAQQGLPPISASDAGVGVQASVGLDRPTRNMILLGLAGLGVAGALVYAARKRR